MIYGRISFNDRQMLDRLNKQVKGVTQTARRGVDAGSYLMADFVIKQHYERVFPMYLRRRTEVLTKFIRRSARRYPSARTGTVLDQLYMGRRAARRGPAGRSVTSMAAAIEHGGAYAQWVRSYTRTARGSGLAMTVRGHLRTRTERRPKRILERSFDYAEDLVRAKVKEAIDVLLATGKVPKLRELYPGAWR